MLSGRPLGKAAEVLRSGVALRIDREDLFELLGERPELLRQLFEGMFTSRRGCSRRRGAGRACSAGYTPTDFDGAAKLACFTASTMWRAEMP